MKINAFIFKARIYLLCCFSYTQNNKHFLLHLLDMINKQYTKKKKIYLISATYFGVKKLYDEGRPHIPKLPDSDLDINAIKSRIKYEESLAAKNKNKVIF